MVKQESDPSETLRRLRDRNISDGVLVVLSVHPHVPSDRRPLATYELQRRRDERDREERRRDLLFAASIGAGGALVGAVLGAVLGGWLG